MSVWRELASRCIVEVGVDAFEASSEWQARLHELGESLGAKVRYQLVFAQAPFVYSAAGTQMPGHSFGGGSGTCPQTGDRSGTVNTECLKPVTPTPMRHCPLGLEPSTSMDLINAQNR